MWRGWSCEQLRACCPTGAGVSVAANEPQLGVWMQQQLGCATACLLPQCVCIMHTSAHLQAHALVQHAVTHPTTSCRCLMDSQGPAIGVQQAGSSQQCSSSPPQATATATAAAQGGRCQAAKSEGTHKAEQERQKEVCVCVGRQLLVCAVAVVLSVVIASPQM